MQHWVSHYRFRRNSQQARHKGRSFGSEVNWRKGLPQLMPKGVKFLSRSASPVRLFVYICTGTSFSPNVHPPAFPHVWTPRSGLDRSPAFVSCWSEVEHFEYSGSIRTGGVCGISVVSTYLLYPTYFWMSANFHGEFVSFIAQYEQENDVHAFIFIG